MNMNEYRLKQAELVPRIARGEDLHVVLENRYGRPYVESYGLTNIFMKDDCFWAKFRNVHASVGHQEIEQGQSLSYAYNNYCDLVCLSGFDKRVVRYYSAEAYTRMEFVTKGEPRTVWHSGRAHSNDLSALFQCVNSAVKLKAKIVSQDGYIYIMPLHTVEVYQDLSGFVAYTEYDGYPEYLRHMHEHAELQAKFAAVRASKPGDYYANTAFLTGMEFFTTHFILTAEHLKHRHLVNAEWQNQDVPAQSVEIIACD